MLSRLLEILETGARGLIMFLITLMALAAAAFCTYVVVATCTRLAGLLQRLL